jgi:hypothetical protein
MTNAELQLVADILEKNKSKRGELIGQSLFGHSYGQKMEINPKAFEGILNEKDKEILRNPKFFPLTYSGEMIRTDMIYNERIKPKLKLAKVI